MKHLSIGLLALAVLGGAHAAELFDGGKLRPIKQGDPMSPADTIGGYALYPGDGKWTFEQGKSDLVVGPTAIWMGKVVTLHRSNSALVAWQSFTANLNRSFDSPGWHGGPCAAEHVVAKTERNGSTESCMTIDPNVNTGGSRPVTYLGIGITHTGARGKYQQIYLALNAELFGFRDTGAGDWTVSGMGNSPRRRQFVDKLTAWAETLRGAAGKSFEKNEPGPFYAAVPSYMSLMTVPDDLRDGDYSLSFIGAVEDLRDKDGFKAIAYSKTGPGETRWSRNWKMATQEEANKGALDACERERAPSRPPCVLYALK